MLIDKLRHLKQTQKERVTGSGWGGGQMASGVSLFLATERKARRRLEQGAWTRSTRQAQRSGVVELARPPPTPFHAIWP